MTWNWKNWDGATVRSQKTSGKEQGFYPGGR